MQICTASRCINALCAPFAFLLLDAFVIIFSYSLKHHSFRSMCHKKITLLHKYALMKVKDIFWPQLY